MSLTATSGRLAFGGERGLDCRTGEIAAVEIVWLFLLLVFFFPCFVVWEIDILFIH